MKTNQLLKSPLALVTIGILATVTAFTVRQGEVTKTAHLTAPKDILQFTSGGHVLGFAADGVYVANGSHALRVEFLKSHSIPPMSAAAPSVPDNANNAKRATPLSKVTYPKLWDGVTLTYDAPSGAIARSTYRLDPHAKVDSIDLRYNAPTAIQKDGSLKINFETGTITESAPKAWQEKEGKQIPIQVAFAQKSENEISFTVGQYDRSEPLFIDPTLTWNTFLGGSGFDVGNALAVDGSGNVYVAGYSDGTWGSPVNAFGGYFDVFVAKLNSNGNLIWNTFLGGSGVEEGGALAVDGSGNVYVAGYTNATWGSPVNAFSGYFDVFAAKLDSNGNLIWNTFLGGSGGDDGGAVAVDGNGNVYVAGESDGTWGSPVNAFSGFEAAFVAKLDSNGNLTWNTFLGGVGAGTGSAALAVDASGNVYVAGGSNGTWGSPVNTYSGGTDAFTAKLDSTGNLTWNTFLGGSGFDVGAALAVDGSGNVYVAGGSNGATWGSPVRAYSGGHDAFAAKLDSTGNLTWNTFLGGVGAGTYGYRLAVDGSGNVYVAGYSNATWGSPVNAYNGGFSDAFAAQLDSTGNLTWNTFLGGSTNDASYGLAVDGSGNVYVAGESDGTWGSPVRAYSGGTDFDAFVAKLSAPAANTPAGSNVMVDIGTVGSAVIALTFPQVTVAGTTTVTPIDPSLAGTLPSAYELTGANLAFQITTTATYPTPPPTPPPIIIAFQVPPPPIDPTFSQWRVLHNEGGTLVDRTATDPAPDPTTQTIYASVSSLSPFVIAKLIFSAQVQQPINADRTSVFSVKRGVVPVKFTLTQHGVATCALPAATIALTRTSGGTTGAVDESVYSGSVDTGSNFRISSCQYIYNLSASALGVGTYRADIKINGTVVGSGIFQLK